MEANNRPISLDILVESEDHVSFTVRDSATSEPQTGQSGINMEAIYNATSLLSSIDRGAPFGIDAARKLAETLSVGLFGGVLRDALMESLERSSGSYLRLGLAFDPSLAHQLVNIPWELAQVPDESRTFLAVHPQIAFVRRLSPSVIGNATPPLNRIQPLGQTLLTAAPSGMDSLRTEQMLRLLRQLSEASSDRLRPPEEGVVTVISDLKQSLYDSDSDVLHLMGHGRLARDTLDGSPLGQFAVSDSSGTPQWLQPSEFHNDVGDTPPALLVLDAAFGGLGGSRSIAGVIAARGVPFVVAGQYALPDEPAEVFMQSFYEQIGNAVHVDLAVQRARQLLLEKFPDSAHFGAILLFMHGDKASLFTTDVYPARDIAATKTLNQSEETSENENDPELPSVWLYLANGEDQPNLDRLANDDEVIWQANPNTREGDLVLMYLRAPHSHIRYLFQAQSDPSTPGNPTTPQTIQLGDRLTLPEPITLDELRQHPTLGSWGLVRANMQGGMQRSQDLIAEGMYQPLRDLILRKNPRLQAELRDSEGILAQTYGAADDVPPGPLMAEFVADETIPDGSLVPAGEPFTKSWRVRNNGQYAWGEGVELVYFGGDTPQYANQTVDVPGFTRNFEGVIEVELVAPSEPRLEPYVSQWGLRARDGSQFGELLVAEFVVVNGDHQAALERVSGLEDPAQRAAQLVELLPTLEEPLFTEGYRQAQATLDNIDDADTTYQLLVQLIQAAPTVERAGLILRAISLAHSATETGVQATRLINLLPLLSGDQQIHTAVQAVDAIQTVADPSVQADLSLSLLPYAPDGASLATALAGYMLSVENWEKQRQWAAELAGTGHFESLILTFGGKLLAPPFENQRTALHILKEWQAVDNSVSATVSSWITALPPEQLDTLRQLIGPGRVRGEAADWLQSLMPAAPVKVEQQSWQELVDAWKKATDASDLMAAARALVDAVRESGDVAGEGRYAQMTQQGPPTKGDFLQQQMAREEQSPIQMMRQQPLSKMGGQRTQVTFAPESTLAGIATPGWGGLVEVLLRVIGNEQAAESEDRVNAAATALEEAGHDSLPTLLNTYLSIKENWQVQWTVLRAQQGYTSTHSKEVGHAARFGLNSSRSQLAEAGLSLALALGGMELLLDGISSPQATVARQSASALSEQGDQAATALQQRVRQDSLVKQGVLRLIFDEAFDDIDARQWLAGQIATDPKPYDLDEIALGLETTEISSRVRRILEQLDLPGAVPMTAGTNGDDGGAEDSAESETTDGASNGAVTTTAGDREAPAFLLPAEAASAQTFDLEVRISREAGQSEVEGTIQLLAVGGIERGQFALDQRLLRDALRQEGFVGYGRALLKTLLCTDKLRDKYVSMLSRAQANQAPLHIRLQLEPSAQLFAGERWELLYDDLTAFGIHFIASDPSTPFSRHLAIGPPPPEPTKTDTLRVLFAIADPEDIGKGDTLPAHFTGLARQVYSLPRIDRASQLKVIEDARDVARSQLAARGMKLEDEILGGPEDDPVTLRRILTRLKEGRFHVLHLVAHGILNAEDGLHYTILEDERRRAIQHSESELARQFGPDDGLRLVFLVNCESGRQDLTDAYAGLAAKLIQENIPAVVAMLRKVSYETSYNMTREFYSNLAYHGSVDQAMNATRWILQAGADWRRPDPEREWAVPVLFMRSRDGRLFETKHTAQKLETPDFEPTPVPGGLRRDAASSELQVADLLSRSDLRPELRHSLLEAWKSTAQDSADTKPKWIFSDDPARRQALLAATDWYRAQPWRRPILFLRQQGRQRARQMLLDDALDDAGWETLFSEGTFSHRNDAPWNIAARPDAGFSLSARELRHWLHPDLAGLASGPQLRGNLTWLCESPPLTAESRQAANALASGEIGGEHWLEPARSILGEEAACLLLHLVDPASGMPFRGEFADRVLAWFGEGILPDPPTYQALYRFALSLQADDALGLDDMPDVVCFLQHVAAWESQPATARLLPPAEIKEGHAGTNRANLPQHLQLDASLVDSVLELPADTFPSLTATLNAGKHVILTGPPGTGKTTLAEDVARHAFDQGYSRGFVSVTATADWTTFDTIGGYMPAPSGELRFRPGVFLQAIQEKKWLIIDEINRADIDKAFGELFTVLSGQAVTLPYERYGHPVRILPPGRVAATANDYVLPHAWRIIGTMNVYDKASLFSMSNAFMRRFAFVDVNVPTPERYRSILGYFISRHPWPARIARETVIARLASLFDAHDSQNWPLMRHRALGPAIAKDMVAYLSGRLAQFDDILGRLETALDAISAAQAGNDLVAALSSLFGHLGAEFWSDAAGLPTAQVDGESDFADARSAFQSDLQRLCLHLALAEAFNLYATPQLDGLEQLDILAIYGSLHRVFDHQGAGRIYRRIEDLFPHIPQKHWAAARTRPSDDEQ